MFNPTEIGKLAVDHKAVLQSLVEIEERLNHRFYEIKPAVRALILAVASGEPLLLVGPPGTAKSKLIRAFCGMTGLYDELNPREEHEGYFEYLLTPFTEPGELFGYYDIGRAMNHEGLVRIDKHSMQKAKVVYLDEVFNGSSAILNSLLTLMNERVWHDRGTRVLAPLQCLFAATNQTPHTSELQAVFDRFVLRCVVENVGDSYEAMRDLIRVGWQETYGNHIAAVSRSSAPTFPDLLEKVAAFQRDIRARTNAGRLAPLEDRAFVTELVQRVKHVREHELSQMSNRRLVKMVYIMLIHRLYEAVRNNELGNSPAPPLSLRPREELALLPRYFLDDTSDEEVLQRLERVAPRSI